MPNFFIFIPAACFGAGILLASFFNVSPFFILFLLLLSFVFLASSLYRSGRTFIISSVSIICFSFGIFLMQNEIQLREKYPVLSEGSHVIEGIVASDPERNESTVFRLKLLKADGADYKSDALVLVRTGGISEINYGDLLTVSGIIKRPENFKTDSGKVFNYVRFLEKDKIKSEISYPKISKIGEGKGNKFLVKLIHIKNSFLLNIGEISREPEASLIGGITIGSKNGILKDLEESFIKTGTIHIVALSGYNITIVAESIIRAITLAPFISVSLGYLFGGISIVIFSFMAGFSSTAVRATIMALIAILARVLGRQYLAGRALILSGFFMLIFNPYLLAFDISFQLSFLATFGLIYFVPMISHWFNFVPKKIGFRDMVAVTIGIQIFLLPFLIYKFGGFSVISPISNILILPVVPIVMAFGFISGILGFVSSILAFPFGAISQLFGAYIIFVTEFFAGFNFALAKINFFPLSFAIIAYTFFLYFIFKREAAN